MFTGIIECMTKVYKLFYDKKNLYISLYNPFSNKIRINQSICHNGICLTIIDFYKNIYSVMASKETLLCTNLNYLKVNDKVNIERSISLTSRIDGHIVQGHVDTTAKIVEIYNNNGDYLFFFRIKKKLSPNMVKKGSIAINGISLTVNYCENDVFGVTIIPYTYKNTNMHCLKNGNIVNIEFDIIGKYISKFLENSYELNI
ncbi:riboflavin synthase [Blattabacterium cuenoti]|uniref:riboflavin synthase n=1 Tax=Blattabacterium cuenoti TaxID=1653831 RepID=UPI00163CFBD0|nr:riboflavin synthase [Blattabacterium cuenoti]